MRIQTYHLTELINFCKSKQKEILLKSDTFKYEEKDRQREIYKSWIFMIKYFNHLTNSRKSITRHQLYFNLKKESLNYTREPFYKIMQKIQEL